jgi:hypothetical protein
MTLTTGIAKTRNTKPWKYTQWASLKSTSVVSYFLWRTRICNGWDALAAAMTPPKSSAVLSKLLPLIKATPNITTDELHAQCPYFTTKQVFWAVYRASRVGRLSVRRLKVAREKGAHPLYAVCIAKKRTQKQGAA